MSTDQQSLPDRLRAHAAAVAWQDRAEIGEDLVAAAGEIERLTLLNEDKFRHLQAYCKAADEDRATMARLTRERDAVIRICYQTHTTEGQTDPWYRLDVDPAQGDDCDYDTESEAVAAVRRAAGLDPEPANERSEA